MSDRWSRRRRCDLCQTKTELYAYDGFMVCTKCKRSMRTSDRQPGGGGHPVQGCFSHGGHKK